MMEEKIGAVVAAAGLSSRMGEFKPLLPLPDGGHETTVIRRCVDNLLLAGAADVVVVVGHRGEEVAAALSGCPVRTVRNPDYATTAMFDSLCIGLRALEACDRVLLTPGDVPWVSPALVQALLASEADFVCPRCGQTRGHPVALRARHIPALLDWRGEGGLRGAVASLGLSTAFVETEEVGATIDLDTPEDYRRLLELEH